MGKYAAKKHQWYLDNKERSFERNRQVLLANQERINKVKVARGCDRCGYNKCPVALDFHHINGDKRFGVAHCGARKWETVEDEIAKCELLCSNCHREKHLATQLWLVSAPVVGAGLYRSAGTQAIKEER